MAITNREILTNRNAFDKVARYWEKRAYRHFHHLLVSQILEFFHGQVGTANPAMITNVREGIIKDGLYKFYMQVASVELEGTQFYEPPVKSLKIDILEFLVNYINTFFGLKVSDITRTTRKYIVREMTNNNQWDIDKLKRSLIESGEVKQRALKIARTETIASLNLTGLLKAAGSRYDKDKYWIDSHDERVRPTNRHGRFNHHANSIAPVHYTEPFVVSGEKLMFPGDISLGASAGNVISCRCSAVYKSRKDSNGRLIVKDRGTPTLQDIYSFYNIKSQNHAIQVS